MSGTGIDARPGRCNAARDATGAIIIRSDVVRKRLAGTPPEVRLPAEAYSPAMDRKVLAQMAFDARGALRAGAVVVLDATFLDQEPRACASAIARRQGVRFDGIWLEIPRLRPLWIG